MREQTLPIRATMPLEERLQGALRFSGSMLEWCRGRGKILIVMHENPDPDCLASALALSRIFFERIGEEPVIAFSGIIGRSENLIMARILEIPLTPFELLDPAEYGVICMVDTQPGTGNNPLDPDYPVHVVIDHHPLRDRTRSCWWVDVKDDYGVTATILYEYLVAHGMQIDTRLATALFYAIKSDTQDLGRDANEPDRKAYLGLFPLADMHLIYQITNPRQPVEYFRTMKLALENARRYDRAIVVDLQLVAYPELIAEMADILLQLEGIEAVLSCGRYANDFLISVRTVSRDTNAGELTRSLVADLGAGGGHTFIGGGKISLLMLQEASSEKVKELLKERFLHSLGLSGVEAVSIL